jgi:molybdopterin molybdotransferase
MMKPFRSTLPLEEALAIVRDTVTPIGRTERVAIGAAHGRVLASSIVASTDVPSFDRASMDGYAVIAADTQGASRDRPVILHLAGRVYAGDTGGTAIGPGVCLEIATGAPLPPGADAVVMVEDTAVAPNAPASVSAPSTAASAIPSTAQSSSSAAVHVFAEVCPSRHIVRRGVDMKRGDPVLEAGAALEPSRIGALAAVGIAEVEVFAKPVVAILPTGNELVAPGQPLPAGHVYDVNRYTIAGLVERHGGIALQLPTVVDTPDAIRDAVAAISNGAGHRASAAVDLLVLCGGSSVGERDLVIDVLRERGEVLFHGIAVKPGKPTAFARLGSTLVLGMPGNPTSCLSNAYVLMIPLLRALARLPAVRHTIVRLPLAQRVSSPRGRLQFLPVRLDAGRAMPTFKGSGEITSLSQADGYITIPADVEQVDEGTAVDVTMY